MIETTKIIFGINVPYQSQRIKKDSGWTKPLEWEPCIRTHEEMFFVLCDICGSQVPPGRVSRGITTCTPACNAKKWDAKNGLIIEQERNACGVRPTSFWITISHECYKRDNYTCQHCKKNQTELGQNAINERMINGKVNPHYHPEDYILNCHHIKPIKAGGNNRLENLVSLCGKRHKIEHSHIRNIARKHKPLITES